MYTAVRIVKMKACRNGHQDLEAGEGDQQGERERQDRRRCRLASTQGGGEHGEADQQQVAGEHVGEEPDRERERPHEDRRDELDRRHQDVERLGHARREADVLEVADGPWLLDADDVEDDPHQHGHEQRQGHAGVHRHLDDRDDLPDVADEDEGEEREQERREAAGPSGPIVCMMMPSWTKSTTDSATFCTPVGTSCWRRLAGEEEDGEDDGDREPHQEHDLVHREGAAARNRSGHSMTWLTGGNSRPSITRVEPPSPRTRLEPGKASEADT